MARDWLKRSAFALLAVVIVFCAGLIILATGRFALDRAVRGDLFTVSAAVQLFSMLFIVAGAAVAVARLIGALCRSRTNGRGDNAKP